MTTGLELLTSDAVIRITLSLLFGSIVGIERELTQKSAGLRTHILVCMGSTIFTLLSTTLPIATHDPGRVVAQVVSGIGFIGGGAVLRQGNNVQGLTTAASLWMMAAIGMLVGVGHYRLAAVSTLLAFLVLYSIGYLEQLYFQKRQRQYSRIRVTLKVFQEQSDALQAWLSHQFSQYTLSLKIAQHQDHPVQTMTLLLSSRAGLNVHTLSQRLLRQPGVRQCELTLLDTDEDDAPVPTA